MGNVVGAIKGHSLRKIRRFNVENRTNRFLDKNVKVVPPKPEATQKEIELLKKEMPNLMEEINKPSPELLGRLKDVFVTSTDPPSGKSPRFDSIKPLPTERTSVFLEYNYVEPEKVSPGRISLRQALQLLSKYQTDKKVNTPEKLALEYNLKKEDAENLVEYFKLYTLFESPNKVIEGDMSTITTEPNITVNIMNIDSYIKKLNTRNPIGGGANENKDEKNDVSKK